MTFARQFLFAPIQTGAVAPSSPSLARAMVDAACLHRADTVVELGPGTGVVTTQVARAIPSHSCFLALELNPYFVEQTRRRCPGVLVFRDDALNLPDRLAALERGPCDAIISSLPWTLFDEATQTELLKVIRAALKPGGRFVTYAYISTGMSPSGRRFRKLLQRTFDSSSQSSLLWNNLPPARIHTCTA